MLLAVFLIAVAAGAYPFLVYPAVVQLVAVLRPRPWRESAADLDTAMVITVHNEEGRIRQKLENTRQLRRPGSRVAVLVASDGSVDAAEHVVRQYPEATWIACPRRGKGYAQKQSLQATNAEIIVFSDVATMIESDGLVEILRPFADPRVGAVSGVDASCGRGAASEQLYLRYETAVRRAESRVGSSIGLSGCFFAVRREIAEHLLEDVDSDLGASLMCLSRGYRAVAQESARCTYAATPDAQAIYRRWRRTALRGIRCLWAYRGVLSWQRPLASWQVISHKWLRFLAPVFFLVAVLAAASAACLGEFWGLAAILPILAVLVMAMLPHLPGLGARRPRIVRPLEFFVLMNVAVLAAWGRLLAGHDENTWTPTVRAWSDG